MATQWLLRAALGIVSVVSAMAAEETAESFREPFAQSFPIRKDQHLQIKAYADRLLKEQSEKALRELEPDFSSEAAYARSLDPAREHVRRFYGTPPPGAQEGRVTKFERVGEDPECTVYRAWIEVVPGVDAYGIYLLPKKRKERAPLLIAQHGGGGTPRRSAISIRV